MVDVWPTLFLTEEYMKTRMDKLGKRLLLCGVKSTREFPYYERVIQDGGQVVIVEPFPPNIEYCRAHYPSADIRESFAQFVEEPFDTVMWIQGPEHVEKDIAVFTLNRFRGVANLVVAECPHGIHPQGPDAGNTWETHRAYLYPEDFDDEWFKVIGPHSTPRENWGPDDNQHMLIAHEKT